MKILIYSLFMVLVFAGSAHACGATRLSEDDFLRFTPPGSIAVRLNNSSNELYTVANQCQRVTLNITENANKIEVIINNGNYCPSPRRDCEHEPNEQFIYGIITIYLNEASRGILAPGEYYRNSGWNYPAQFFTNAYRTATKTSAIRSWDDLKEFSVLHHTNDFEHFSKKFNKFFHSYLSDLATYSWEYSDAIVDLIEDKKCKKERSCSFKVRLLRFTTTERNVGVKPLKFDASISLARELKITTKSSSEDIFNHSLIVQVEIPQPAISNH